MKKRGKSLQIEPGTVFNRLTALEYAYTRPRDGQYWRFRCECGQEVVKRLSSVYRGKTKSCGCMADEMAKQRTPPSRKKSFDLSPEKIEELWRTALRAPVPETSLRIQKNAIR